MSANNDPATGVVAITPSDTVNIAYPEGSFGVRGFTANGAGNVSFVASDNTTGLIAVLAGYVYPIRLKRVNATNTTATGLTGLL